MKINYRNLVAAATLVLVGVASPVVAQEVEITPTEKNTQSIALLESKVSLLSNLKVSGYIQTQWVWSETGGKMYDQTKPNVFSNVERNAFSIRRGRVKFAYTQGIASFVIQPDFTEKGVSIKDAYALITSPNKVIAAQMGAFDRPFGYEISYSSSLRETAERSRVFLALFPGERGIGAQVVLKGKDGLLSKFTLNAGLFNGNGLAQETDSKKDFIGRLAFLNKTANSQYGIAVSYYNGGVMNPGTYTGRNAKNTADSIQANKARYDFEQGKGFVKSTVDQYSYEKREYIGFGAQYLLDWAAGTTSIKGEAITGTQPGTSKENANLGSSKTSGSFGADLNQIYNRQFFGGYVQLFQNIGATKHTLVLKYDLYDPNTKISGDKIGRADFAKTSSTDIAITTISVGYLYRLNANIRLMAQYDMVSNEKSANLKSTTPAKDYSSLIAQNAFTARVQIKF